jgi:hypothetical protein
MLSRAIHVMSPKPKHIPDEAYRTTIRLADDEQFAISFLKTARRQKGNDRKTLNDILVDGIWLLLEKEEAKSKLEIRAMMPVRPAVQPTQANVTEMPKPKSGR